MPRLACISRLRRLALGLACLVALPGAHPAPSPDEIRALQFALTQVHDYDTGPVDGVIGPRTEAAMAAYAGARPLESGFWAVAAHLETLVWWQAPWTPDAERALRAALPHVRLPYYTVRGSAPRVLERRMFVLGDRQAACVQVATREGKRWLHFELRPILVQPRLGGGPRPGLRAAGPATVPARAAELWCTLGYLPA